MKNTEIYAAFFENIDEQTSINEFEKFIDINASFKDPFHEVKGLHKFYEVFQKMYKNLEEPRFKIEEILENKNVGYIRWIFTFRFKNDSSKQQFTGVSRVIFNSEDKAISHEDYWDAASNIYEKIPIVSSILKYVKNKIKA